MALPTLGLENWETWRIGNHICILFQLQNFAFFFYLCGKPIHFKRKCSFNNYRTFFFFFQVNFSKKKRNRMRNNEAAIIALSKSRSQFFHHKDTDSLVDNEAVIVYDERTAL